MNRLQAELQRLFLPDGAELREDGFGLDQLLADRDTTRVAVLQLSRPLGWDEISAVWQGVQQDLDFPPPAIAISGHDRYELWFSFAEPVPVSEAQDMLQGLQQRYVASTRSADRIGFFPPRGPLPHTGEKLPPSQVAPGQWSAFVAPDLGPLFSDERWLDHPPGTDAQADLLSRFQSIPAQRFARAMAQLRAEAAPPAQELALRSSNDTKAQSPQDFLLEVMRDPAVDLPLRVDAAKALLAFQGRPSGG